MKTLKILQISLLSIALLVIGLPNSQAQTVANYIGASGGDWNTAGNWDTALVPGVSTNASLPTNIVVNYTAPMTSPSVGAVTNNGGTLNVSAAGFNVDVGGTTAQSIVLTVGSRMTVTTGGAVTITNSGLFFLNTNAVLTVNNATLTFTNTLGTYDLMVGRGGRNNGATVGLTNSTVNLSKQLVIQGGGASGLPASSVYLNGGTLATPSIVISNSTDDAFTYLVVDGGANVQGGDVVIQRGIPTYGLVLSNGTVNVTSLLVGTGASRAGVNVFGGTLTNTGAFSMGNGVGNGTSDRKAYFFQRGGTVVGTASSGLVIVTTNGTGTSGSAIANQGAVYDITAGTLTVEGITLLANNTLADVTARLNLGGSGAIYVGSGGTVANFGGSGSVATISCTNGTVGAKADWSGSAPMLINAGTTVFRAADGNNTAHNIALTGVVSGSGTLSKTGAGTLTLNGTNTHSGTTLINAGTLALGATGSSPSPLIVVGTGAVFDVSAQGGAYSPGLTVPSQTLAGFGSVSGLVTATNGVIQPGSNNVTGTLTFAGGLTEPGNANNKFILSNDPVNGSNDLIAVTGNLTVSNTNNVTVVGSLPSGSNYTLITYTGSFIGDVTNFNLVGATGFLTNIVATKSIVLHALTTTRGPTNIVWVGNPTNENWDTAISTNWLNGSSLDFFVLGDSVRFTASGGVNTNVTLVGSLLPTLVTVDAPTDYYFVGSGSIDGGAGLTKTNAGTLTIGTMNNYVGVTTIAGGVLQVSNVANGTLPSPLGAASSDPLNVVINDGTLRYFGANATTDRGATLGGSAATIDVTTNGTLTLTGNLAGTGNLTKVGDGTLNLNGSGTYGGTTTLSNGTLQVNGPTTVGAGTINFAGGTLTIPHSSGQVFYNSTLNVVAPSTLVYVGADANAVIQGAWSGSSVLNLNITNAAGLCTLNHDLTTNFTGTIRMTDNSPGSLRFNAGGNSTGPQQCTGSPTATFDFGNSFVTLVNRNGGGTNFGTYFLGALAGGTNGTIRGSTANSGTTYQIGDKNLNTTFSGAIANGTGGSAATVAITKSGTGTLTLNGDLVVTITLDGVGNQITNNALGNPVAYTGPTTISNGVLAVVTPVALTNSPVITLAGATAVLDASLVGFVDGTPSLVTNGILEMISGQTLAGIGTILATNVLADAGSTVNPGLLEGTLNASQAIELAGAVNMNVNAAATPNCSKIASPTITIDGTATLVVTNLGPENAATFHLFSQAVSGFASVTLPTLTGTNSWVNNLAVDGSITLVAPQLVTVNTNATNITFAVTGAGNNLTLNLSWPADHIGWRLLEETNSLAKGLVLNTNNWFVVTNATTTNQISIPINVTNGTAFFRLVYP